jgi:hypothetical protein
MYIARSGNPRLSSLLANAGRSATILALLVCAPATAQVEATIAAGTEETLAGIKTYEVATEADAGTESDLWFCQVVGKPSVAGSISITESGGNISAVARHAKSGAEITAILLQDRSFFVTRGGVQIAAVIPSPPGSGLPPTTIGTQALSADPAWQVFRTAMTDSNLKASMEAGGTAPTTECMGNCAQQWPTPPGCDPAAPTVYCCQVKAERDYCESLCRCEGSVLPSACRAVAAAEYMADWLDCSIGSLENF